MRTGDRREADVRGVAARAGRVVGLDRVARANAREARRVAGHVATERRAVPVGGARRAELSWGRQRAGGEEHVVVTSAARHARWLLLPAIVGVAGDAILHAVGHPRKFDVRVRKEAAIGGPPIVGMRHARGELLRASMEAVHLGHDRIRRVPVRVVTGVAGLGRKRVDVEVADGARVRARVAVVHIEVPVHRAAVAGRARGRIRFARRERAHDRCADLKLGRRRELVNRIRASDEQQHGVGALCLGGDRAERVAKAAVAEDREVAERRIRVGRLLQIDVVVACDGAVRGAVEE